jgi:hypothetical protein
MVISFNPNTQIKGELSTKKTTIMNECKLCGYNNPKDNFRCEAEDCGVPLDLEITINDLGLPEIN